MRYFDRFSTSGKTLLQTCARLAGVSALLLVGCASETDGLVKYPVRGKVLIDGAPQAGIVVRFNLLNSNDPGHNARFPVGVTDDQGAFELSTNGKNDGAVAGEYAVAFVWPEQNDPPPGDHFGGVYSDPKRSQIQVRIEPGENVLESFSLKKVSPSRPGLPRE